MDISRYVVILTALKQWEVRGMEADTCQLQACVASHPSQKAARETARQLNRELTAAHDRAFADSMRKEGAKC